MKGGHAIRENGVGYWLRLSANTVAYYARQRRWAALLRASWLTIVRGYYLEVCEVCGRKVGLVWHAEDELYQAATNAGMGGLFCVPCFDRLAWAVMGEDFPIWVPMPRRALVAADGSWLGRQHQGEDPKDG